MALSRVRRWLRGVGAGALRDVRERCRAFLGPLERAPDAPDLFRTYRQLAMTPGLERRPGGWMYAGSFYPDYLTVGGASHAIFPVAARWCRGRGVDVGAGHWPLPGAVPVDEFRGAGLAHALSEFPAGSLDYVFSSHCLEHIEEWRAALAEWVGRVRQGGIVFLYLPHPDCAIWRPGAPMVGSGHKWSPTPDVVASALVDLRCEIVARDDGPDMMQSFHLVARRGDAPG